MKGLIILDRKEFILIFKLIAVIKLTFPYLHEQMPRLFLIQLKLS